MIKITKYVNRVTFAVVLMMGAQTVGAEEMEQEHDPSMHSGHSMDEHAGHDTGSARHIHHQHGKGAWMFEYRYMHMDMEGLRDGTSSVDSRDISGAMMGTSGPAPGKDYRMAPTAMTMDMHMAMAMYGFTDKFTLMGMVSYLDNSMDMVMHMYNMSGYTGDMTAIMETSGVGDTFIAGMFTANMELTVSLGLSIPTGSIDEKVLITAGNSEEQAPYRMQLGSGTYDLVPSVTYSKNIGNNNWGGQAEYTYHMGTNDNDYTLGDRFEVTAWMKFGVHPNILLTSRVEYANWQNVDGQDSKVMNIKMSPAFDPNAQGGSRTDILLGVNGMFGKGHMVGFEVGVPVLQDLNGPQLETDFIFSLAYQYAM